MAQVNCPTCDRRSRTIDSRATGQSVRRRRTCPKCKRRWSTIETPATVQRGALLAAMAHAAQRYYTDKIEALRAEHNASASAKDRARITAAIDTITGLLWEVT